jgi:hypothetical protein
VAAALSHAFLDFLTVHSQTPAGCSRLNSAPLSDNVASRFELPQPVREPKFIGTRDRIVGHRNYLTPQGGKSTSAKCFLSSVQVSDRPPRLNHRLAESAADNGPGFTLGEHFHGPVWMNSKACRLITLLR